MHQTIRAEALAVAVGAAVVVVVAAAAAVVVVVGHRLFRQAEREFLLLRASSTTRLQFGLSGRVWRFCAMGRRLRGDMARRFFGFKA